MSSHHAPARAVGGRHLSLVSPEVYGVSDAGDKTFKKIEHSGGVRPTGYGQRQGGGMVAPSTRGQKSPNLMSDHKYVSGERLKRKLISQTRKWGDHVDVGFNAGSTGLSLAVTVEPLVGGDKIVQEGAAIYVEDSPPGQYLCATL